MNTYKLEVNAAGKFQPKNMIKVGTVRGNNKSEALHLANEARKGLHTDAVNFEMNMDNDMRHFILTKIDL